jgi:2,3-dimethylmalate lyase
LDNVRPSAADKRKALRKLLSGPSIILAPGIYDAFGARVVEAVGFPAVYLTGNGVSASLIGRPDVGLLSMSEVVDHARRVASAVDIPLIADADTGYGNALNVIRTVEEFDAAGVAGIHLEDQVSPKRCGHMAGAREVISLEEMLGKLEAAVWARSDSDLAIIGRTDCYAAHGMDEAIRRARAFAQAGADLVFVHVPGTAEELRTLAGSVDAPLMLNMDESGRASQFTAGELEEMGYRLAIYPGSVRYSLAWIAEKVLRELRETGTTRGVRDRMASFDRYNELLGLDQVNELESRFLR